MSKIEVRLNKFEKEVFDFIYDLYNQRGNPVAITIMDLQRIAKKKKLGEKEIAKSIHKFRGYSLLERNSTIDYHASADMILTYEENLPRKSVCRNHNIRRDVLSFLNKKFNEDPGLAWKRKDFLQDEKLSRYTKDELLRNLWILKSLDLISGCFFTGGEFYFRMTTKGRTLI